jgi:hypothetical protein
MEKGNARLGFGIDVDRSGTHALVASRLDPSVFVVPLDGGEPRRMPGFTQGESSVNPVAFSPDDRFAVAAGNWPAMLRIWDLESDCEGYTLYLERGPRNLRMGSEVSSRWAPAHGGRPRNSRLGS